MVPYPKTPMLNCFYHLLCFYFLTVSEFSCLAKSYSVSGLTSLPRIPNQHAFIQKSAHEVLDANLEARVRPVFTSNHLLYPFVIESLYLSLLCLSVALLCYTGFQNYSLIPSISCSCSTCCFGLGFQHQNLQDFIKTIRALIKDIFPVAEAILENLSNRH